MTTTPPPMPESRYSQTGDINDMNHFTRQQIEDRDAQWMERIAALEAENKRFREHLEKQNAELDELIPMAQKLEADRKMLREALEDLLDDTQHTDHPNCEDGPCPVRAARTALESTHD